MVYQAIEVGPKTGPGPPLDVVYFIQAERLRLVKIGRTNDPRRRLQMLQVGSPDKLVLRGVFASDDAGRLERQFHTSWAHCRVMGEWFDPDERMNGFMSDCLWQPEELLERRVYWSFLPEPDPGPPIASVTLRKGESARSAAKRLMAMLEAADA